MDFANGIIDSIFKGKYKNVIIPEMMLQTAQKLWQAVRSEWGADNTTYTSDKAKWLNRTHNNIYAFSAAKSYTQLVELRNAVFDTDGKTKSYTQFRESAKTILDKYNELYLETEYEAVKRSTIMGRKWLDIERNKDIYPYLKYVTAGDERVRQSHRKLEGVTLPVDSAFWKQYYPPNGWLCRCSVKQLSEAHDLSDEKASMKQAATDTPDYWRKNVGTTDIFEENNTAYFKDFPKKQLDAQKSYGMKALKDIYQRTDLENLPERFEKIEAFEEWTKNVQNLTDYDGLPLRTTEKLFEKTKNKNRWQDARVLTDTINTPNEVWQTEQHGTNNEVFRVYLKFYKDKPVIVLASLEGEIQSFYRWDKDLSGFEQFRKGILQKK